MAQFYEWKRGDHICEVAQRFNLTCKELIAMNNITNIDFIKPGDILRIEDRIIKKGEE